MSLNTPVVPVLSSVTANSLIITAGNDSNPVGTYYSFKVISTAGIQYVNAIGQLQSTNVWLLETATSVTDLIPNTSYTVSLSAATDAVGTGATVYGTAAVAITLAASPAASSFANIYSSTFTATWGVNGNPVGTEYYVKIATDAGFTQNVQISDYNSLIGRTFVNLDSSTTYYAEVKARNSDAVETSFVGLGNVTTLTGPDTVKAIQVLNLLVSRGYLIKWAGNLEPDVVSYYVYRSSSPTDNSSFVVIGTVPVPVTSFFDQVPFTFGIVYYYKVTAIDVNGNESDLEATSPSSDSTFHTFEEQPFAATVTVADFIYDEQPAGILDSSNKVFVTANAYRKLTVEFFKNGLKLTRGVDFAEGPQSQQITLVSAPTSTDVIRVNYQKY